MASVVVDSNQMNIFFISILVLAFWLLHSWWEYRVAFNYLQIFSEFIENPIWTKRFLGPSVEISGKYKDREMEFEVRYFESSGFMLMTLARPHIDAHPTPLLKPIWKYPSKDMSNGLVFSDNSTVCYTKRIGSWAFGRPQPLSRSEVKKILDDLRSGCEKVEEEFHRKENAGA